MSQPNFASRVVTWFDSHGRKSLPWQRPATPYRVWVSEVMLQQTQVATVIPYFERFMARYPSVKDLAEAPPDDVLHHWSGLGYYARARNLHAAAKIVASKLRGEFPSDLDGLIALPGIGRSTAGAILALSQGIRAPILDGNVKRVLCRHGAIEGYPGQAATAKQLWELAERLTPEHHVGLYTQAMMDLGATVCLRRRPLCAACPVAEDCLAKASGRQHEFPTPKPRKTLPLRSTVFLIIENSKGEVLLQRRPPAGIWGGLWSFPEHPAPLPTDVVPAACKERLGLTVKNPQALPLVSHGFTHYRLDIYPIRCRADGLAVRPGVMESPPTLWYNVATPQSIGLAAPVRVLLDRLKSPDRVDTLL